MPVLRPTPVLAPLALCSLAIVVLTSSCSVDHRRLREDASGGCSSAEMSNCEAESGGVVTSRSTGGTPSTGAGGTSSEAGQGVGARDGGAGDSGAGSEASTGAPCSSDDECRAPEAGVAQCLTDWPGGYCSGPCVEFTDCAGGDGTLCRNVDGENRCLVGCFGALDCRKGYRCDETLFGCVPE
ncbi:MAG TPA: hypothetical protein VG937_18370 [Polyangiaceae bacterium]|jgi:hypothetical protein|nr:hypothetical protein [Polyangiaceae bacterium]